ncbi:MAG: hypothetical protein GY936_14305 [Ignavibacteriae bacterium]|nr:hypothetical protein [Ignavibacteriota bacterium]
MAERKLRINSIDRINMFNPIEKLIKLSQNKHDALVITNAEDRGFRQGLAWAIEITIAIRELASAIESVKTIRKSETICPHPFASVMSKCNGEINKCLKCGENI